jgi:hypothetical protein
MERNDSYLLDHRKCQVIETINTFIYALGRPTMYKTKKKLK